jgi:hypothetical protein
MASAKASDPSIQQYNVFHSDVIIQSSAILLVTFNSLNSISDIPITDALQEEKPAVVLPAVWRLEQAAS